MSKLEQNQTDRIYLSIVQGSLRQVVPEGTPDAVVRKWEAGGQTGIKHELVHRAITGKIVGVSFYEGETGGRKFQNINLSFDADEGKKTPVISTGTGTRYCRDILKKLPNIDFNEEVKIRPFAFTPEGEDKEVIGVEILQRDGRGEFAKKIQSYFHKKDGDKTISINGYPTPEGKTEDYTQEDWQIFGNQVKKFLVQYTREKICPKFFVSEKIDKPLGVDEISNPDAIPWD
jgi:hypothetical protein